MSALKTWDASNTAPTNSSILHSHFSHFYFACLLAYYSCTRSTLLTLTKVLVEYLRFTPLHLSFFSAWIVDPEFVSW
jgi:hypothetical protein